MVTTEEIGSVLRNLGLFPTEQELQQMLKEIDIDGFYYQKFTYNINHLTYCSYYWDSVQTLNLTTNKKSSIPKSVCNMETPKVSITTLVIPRLKMGSEGSEGKAM